MVAFVGRWPLFRGGYQLRFYCTYKNNIKFTATESDLIVEATFVRLVSVDTVDPGVGDGEGVDVEEDSLVETGFHLLSGVVNLIIQKKKMFNFFN
jgi:hypothetical protein